MVFRILLPFTSTYECEDGSSGLIQKEAKHRNSLVWKKRFGVDCTDTMIKKVPEAIQEQLYHCCSVNKQNIGVLFLNFCMILMIHCRQIYVHSKIKQGKPSH
jgi:hypothetical protein